MSVRLLRGTLRWGGRVLGTALLLLAMAAGGLWWWSGQDGSLEWALQRAAPGELQVEGVQGALRSGWRIERLVWERAGLRVVAQNIRLEWQPAALLQRKLRLDQVRVGEITVLDQRKKDEAPWRPPQEIRLPWQVTLDELQVDRLSWRNGTVVEASGLLGRYVFDGVRHRTTLRALQLAGGSYEGEAALEAVLPMALELRLAGRFATAVPGLDAPVALQFEARAQGPLAGFEARAHLRVPQEGVARSQLPSATATARITPFATMPLPRAAADFRQLDLSQFWPAAPHTALSGQVQVAPAGAARWQLRADVRNAAPGPWDANRLPVEQLRAEGEWRDGHALVRDLQAQLAGGTVAGRGAWEGQGWEFEGRVQDLDPARLHSSLAALPLSGPVKLAGADQSVDFDVALQAAPGARSGKAPRAGPQDPVLAAVGALELREVHAQGRWAGRTLALLPLRIRTSDAVLAGRLKLDLEGVAGEGHLDLRAPGLRASAEGMLARRRGRGHLEFAASELALAQAWLARLPVVAEALAGVRLQGRGEGRLAWIGGWSDPALQGRVEAAQLQWSRATPPPAPWVLRHLQLQVDGRLRDAALQLQAEAAQGQRQLRLTAAGQLAGTLEQPAAGWRGAVSRLALELRDPQLTPGPWQLELQEPVGWRHAAGAWAVDAGQAVLRAPAMRSGTPARKAGLAWEPVRSQAGTLVTAGTVSGLPLAWLELLGGPQLAGTALAGDMVFDASWRARLGATAQIEASLVRTGGDLTVLAEGADGAAARVSAGVRDARLTLRSEGAQLLLSLVWDSERAGTAQGQLRTRLARTPAGGWSWPQQAPLQGQVQARLPRIGVWSLLAPPGWRLRGSLRADLQVAGTRAQPLLSGPLEADDLALRSVVDGIELRNGHLRARLEGRRLVVREFMLRGAEEGGSGGGTLVAFGEGAWTPRGVVLQASAQLTRLRASIRSDRQLTLSGPVTARMGPQGTSITGQLQVDRARIQLPEETAPRLGEDVVVRNAPGVPATEAERRQPPAPGAGGRTVTLEVTIDLGDDFRVSGRGIATRLAGSVQLAGRSLEVPRLSGTIRTVGGTYEGYGQRMAIERGELRFTGPPGNPALDILAIRPNLEQRVGVRITGRAQAPHIELYSEAGLPDAETLSWLVLGRSSGSGGAETALLQRAATALLAGRGGTGKGIAGRLGLDDLSVGRDASGDGAVVRLGKRFADNFYAAYERSLSGTMGTLYIFYDVSQRLTVRAEAGERTAVDLIFTFAFDRLRR